MASVSIVEQTLSDEMRQQFNHYTAIYGKCFNHKQKLSTIYGTAEQKLSDEMRQRFTDHLPWSVLSPSMKGAC